MLNLKLPLYKVPLSDVPNHMLSIFNVLLTYINDWQFDAMFLLPWMTNDSTIINNKFTPGCIPFVSVEDMTLETGLPPIGHNVDNKNV